MQTSPLRGRRVHFVGIGGVGMAALAELLLSLGYEVSGSDIGESAVELRLRAAGAAISVGPHRAGEAVHADHVVVSNAVPMDSPAVTSARSAGAEVLMRAELLGRVFNSSRGVAVSGTAGKTSTSAMLAFALEAAGMDPTYLVGGDLVDSGSGARLGASDIVVAEADEAFGSFLHLRPALAVVTNIDRDHLDHYATLDAIDDAFRQFLDARIDGGPAVVCGDDAGVRRIQPDVRPPVVTYGFGDADVVAFRHVDGWQVTWHGRTLGTLALRVPGRHQVSNALAAVTAAVLLGADAGEVLTALGSFAGVDRRFSTRGVAAGVTVIDDYAHHPAKVAATLQAARELHPGARIVVLFQPHLYSRTRDLADDFGRAFADADILVVTDVYGQRESPIPGVTGRLISDAVRISEARPAVTSYVPALQDALDFVVATAETGDVVLTMGAGDVTTAAPRILRRLAGA